MLTKLQRSNSIFIFSKAILFGAIVVNRIFQNKKIGKHNIINIMNLVIFRLTVDILLQSIWMSTFPIGIHFLI